MCFYRDVGECAASDDGGAKLSADGVRVCLRLYSGLADLTTSCKRLQEPLASFDALILTSREELLEGAFAGLGFSLLNHTRALLDFACCCPVDQKLPVASAE